jgi:hypothetical protein
MSASCPAQSGNDSSRRSDRAPAWWGTCGASDCATLHRDVTSRVPLAPGETPQTGTIRHRCSLCKPARHRRRATVAADSDDITAPATSMFDPSSIRPESRGGCMTTRRSRRDEVVAVPRIWLTFALSIVVHIAALWVVLPRLPLLPGEEQGQASDRLQVRLALPPPALAPPPPPKLPACTRKPRRSCRHARARVHRRPKPRPSSCAESGFPRSMPPPPSSPSRPPDRPSRVICRRSLQRGGVRAASGRRSKATTSDATASSRPTCPRYRARSPAIR